MSGPRPSRLGPGAEFDFVRAYVRRLGPLPEGVSVGPGDDAAVLDVGPLAVSTDASVEDVHFRRAWLPPHDVGWRAGAAALSDLAAMAADPVALLVSMASSADDVASGWTAAVLDGLRDVAQSVGAGVIGGDVSRSPGGAFVDVVALGRCPSPLLRSGARPGDAVYVTGVLGGAAGAVACLSRGREAPAALRQRFTRPVPRTSEALWLVGRADATAGIDLSDGLAGDARHVAAASGVAVVLDVGRVPSDPGLEAAGFADHDALRLSLTGGEDYEMLFVGPPAGIDPLATGFQDRFGAALSRVGWVEEGEGVWLQDASGSRREAPTAFDHFSETGGR